MPAPLRLASHCGSMIRMKTRHSLTLLLLVVVLYVPATAAEIGAMQFPEGEVQHAVRAGQEPWEPCPPALATGCEMAVLEGDPGSDDLFTVRVRIAEGATVVPPHWHPKDERVTILSGGAAVGFGLDPRREAANKFGPGDYYVNARHAIHTVWLEGPLVLQITGIGPWKAVPASEPPGAVEPVSSTSNPQEGAADMAKGVTGIGGVFFKSADPKATREWYQEHLGVPAGEYGWPFLWRDLENPEERGYTVWGPFEESTDYFDPSDTTFMINYRVADIDGLVDSLQKAGVEVVAGPDEHPNGKFAWILDPDGRKIELWEPVPSAEDPYLPQED